MGDQEIPGAGWYADPDGEHRLRYWDGYQWTEHRKGAAGSPDAGAVDDGATVDEAPNERRWYQRKRLLLPVTGFVGLLLGVAIAGADPEAQDGTEADEAVVEADLAAERERATEAEEAQAALEGEHAEEIATLEERTTALEEERDGAFDAARAELEEERDEILSAAEEEAEEILARAEGRMAALDEREADLDDRAADLDVAEERAEESTFGSGMWVVGDDVLAGQYRAVDALQGCYWARLQSDGDSIINNHFSGEPGPVVATMNEGELFETSGCGQWQRMD